MEPENVTTIPEWDEPQSFGDALKERTEASAKCYEENQKRFAIWDSLSQDIKDKLDQLAGYKPL